MLKITSDEDLDPRYLCTKFEVNRLKRLKVRARTERRTDKQTKNITTMNTFIFVIIDVILNNSLLQKILSNAITLNTHVKYYYVKNN